MRCQITADWLVDHSDFRSKKRRNTNDSSNLKNSVSEYGFKFYQWCPIWLTLDCREDPRREPERGEAVTDNGNRGDG